MHGRTPPRWNTARFAALLGIVNGLLIAAAPCAFGLTVACAGREPATTIGAVVILFCVSTPLILGPGAMALGVHAGITSFTEGMPEYRRRALVGIIGGLLGTLASTTVFWMAWSVSRLP